MSSKSAFYSYKNKQMRVFVLKEDARDANGVWNIMTTTKVVWFTRPLFGSSFSQDETKKKTLLAGLAGILLDAHFSTWIF